MEDRFTMCRWTCPPRAGRSTLASGAGNIVAISSVNASLPDPLVIDYSAAKTALTNFSKSLSKEVDPAPTS